jgi:hypothetical protein
LGRIAKSAAAGPDGLLSHENMVYSLFPMHVIIRQYWPRPNCIEQDRTTADRGQRAADLPT